MRKFCSESANRFYHKPRDPSYFYVAFAEKLLNFYSPIPAKWKMHKHWLVCQNNQLTGKYLGLVFIKTFKLQKPSVSYTIICLVLAKFPHPAWMFFFQITTCKVGFFLVGWRSFRLPFYNFELFHHFIIYFISFFQIHKVSGLWNP